VPLVTVDFETFYSSHIGFKKQTTEEYINDPLFQVIGVGIKVDDGVTTWHAGEDAGKALRAIDWASSAVLCHNTLFDGAILTWRYGIKPAYLFDTLSMARAVHGVEAGGSLAALAERYALGEKGTEVVNAFGKRLQDFSPEDLAKYGEYCINDVELTYKLFHKLAAGFPESELDLIDMTLRMFTEPQLQLDDALMVDRLEAIQQEKHDLLTQLTDELGTNEEGVRKILASNPKFAEVLRTFHVIPPMKISSTTGKETYAFAKTDEEFIALQEHEDPFIRQLCAVRLGTKSTIEESRIERFINVGKRNKGSLPVPLKYYGAHTGRWSGMDAVNLQNLPSRDKAKKALKNAIIAPLDSVVINCDSSQIEARVLAWLSGQDDVVDQFARGEDVYSIFASKVYGFEVSKEFPTERFVGKTCLGAGTRVLTRRGWVPIVEVSLHDELWDGVEWVKHCGVSFMGVKQTINLHGLELTPDHEILTDRTKWVPARYVQTHDTAFQSALSSATSPSSGMYSTNLSEQTGVGVGSPYAVAGFAGVRGHTRDTIYVQVDRPHVTPVGSAMRGRSGGGNINPHSPTMLTELGYSTGYALPLRGVTPPQIAFINIMGRVGSLYATSGEPTDQNFYGTCKRLRVGITQCFKWIVSTLTRATSRGISGSYQLAKTCLTKEPVYDILNSGSRNRFTVLTDRGPIIVHNCVLGLGYGTGAAKLRHTLATQPPGADIELEESERIVRLYRDSNYRIVDLWRECDQTLRDLCAGVGKPYYLGKHKCVIVCDEGLKLPNGMYIRYKDLRADGRGHVYSSRKGPVNIWGGTMVENVVQALARIIVGEQMRWISKQYRVALTVHDAAVLVVPEKELDSAKEYVELCMSTPPAWAKGLPVACELKFSESYGRC